jgi:sugar phosphate isomerase/epimerase
VQHGGEDPVAYLERYAGRVPLLHLKDMAPGEDRAFAEVGEGILDIPGILQAAEKAGTEWIIVEQDVCRRPPLESVRLSLENLKEMCRA